MVPQTTGRHSTVTCAGWSALLPSRTLYRNRTGIDRSLQQRGRWRPVAPLARDQRGQQYESKREGNEEHAALHGWSVIRSRLDPLGHDLLPETPHVLPAREIPEH